MLELRRKSRYGPNANFPIPAPRPWPWFPTLILPFQLHDVLKVKVASSVALQVIKVMSFSNFFSISQVWRWNQFWNKVALVDLQWERVERHNLQTIRNQSRNFSLCVNLALIRGSTRTDPLSTFGEKWIEIWAPRRMTQCPSSSFYIYNIFTNVGNRNGKFAKFRSKEELFRKIWAEKNC